MTAPTETASTGPGTHLRPVKLWDAEIVSTARADGSVLVAQVAPLGAHPETMSERLEHWAAVAPHRTWMAERAPGGGDWQRVSYGEALSYVRSIGQALLEILRDHHKSAQIARDDLVGDFAPVMGEGDVQITGAGEGGGQRLRRSRFGFLHDADAHRAHIE